MTKTPFQRSRFGRRTLALAVILAAGAVVTLASTEDEPVRRLIDFTLTDQFDREYTPGSFDDKVIIVIHGDKDGSAFTGTWGSSLGGAVGSESVAFIPVANLKGVPFFIKGWVKRQFSKDENQWTLLDWDGDFAAAYDLQKAKCNLLIFDRNHKLVRFEAVTEMDEEMLNDLVAEITGLVNGSAE